MQPQPYPYERWPRIPRPAIPLLRRATRGWRAWDADAAWGALVELLGMAPSPSVGPPAVVPADALAGRLPDPTTALVLTGEAPDAPFILQVDPDLALWVVKRTLQADTEGHPTPGGPLTEGERGVLAYVAARVLAASTAPWRVANVLHARRELLSVLGGDPVVIWPISVRLAGRPFGAWAMVPAWALARWHQPTAWPPEGGHLASVRLSLVAEAGWARVPAQDLRSAQPGDVLILDEAWLRPQGPPAPVRVRAVGACRTVWWCAVDEAGLRMERVEASCETSTGEGRRMTHDETTATLVDRVGDVPVEVTVELARFSLPLEELGRLAPGEVLLSGRAVGERVVLRAGGHAIATGELVDVEGEVGVRVLERM